MAQIKEPKSVIQWMMQVQEELDQYLHERRKLIENRSAFSKSDMLSVINHFKTWPHTRTIPDVIEVSGSPVSLYKFTFGSDYFSPGGTARKMRYLCLMMDHLSIARKSFRSFQTYMPIYVSLHALNRFLERSIWDYGFLATELRSVIKLSPTMLLYFTNRENEPGPSRVFFLPSTRGGFVCRFRPGTPDGSLHAAIDVRTYLSVHDLTEDQKNHRDHLIRNLIPHDEILKNVGIKTGLFASRGGRIECSEHREPDLAESELLDLISEYRSSVPLKPTPDRLDAMLWGVPEGSRHCTGPLQPVT